MVRRRRILNHVRSNLVAYIALFFAVSGTAAYAGGPLIYSDDIADGQVFSVDVADDNLTGVDVHNSGLTGADIADSSLTGLDVATNSIPGFDIADNSVAGAKLADNSVPGAKVADNTLTGADVVDNSLTGADIAESTLNVAGMGCQSGKVLGFARVHGVALTRDGGWDLGWTSDPRYIDIVSNCSGGEVLVRGASGFYDVKFIGNPAALAVVTNNLELGSGRDNIVSVGREYSAEDGWYFRVRVEDVCGPGDSSFVCKDGTNNQSGNFTILLP